MTGKPRIRVFVISPIGGAKDNWKTERRDFADSVFHNIIEPACNSIEEAYVVPIRGDLRTGEKDIVKRFVTGINEFEIVLAVLSEPLPQEQAKRGLFGRRQAAPAAPIYNPNVFYEVGIAHAAGRPVILLQRAGQDLPFDIQMHNEEVIQFEDGHVTGDLDASAAAKGAQVDGPATILAQHMRELIANQRYYEKPFRKDISLGRQGVRNRFSAISWEEWSSEILSANREIYLAGTSLASLVDRDQGGNFLLPNDKGDMTEKSTLTTLLATKVAQGVSVTILMNHPHNPANWIIERESGKDEDRNGQDESVDGVIKQCTEAFEFWSRARAECFGVLQKEGLIPADQALADWQAYRVIQVRRNAVLHRMFVTDKRALVTPNIYHTNLRSTPVIDARPDAETGVYERSAHAYFLADVRYLAELNDTAREKDLLPPIVDPVQWAQRPRPS